MMAISIVASTYFLRRGGVGGICYVSFHESLAGRGVFHGYEKTTNTMHGFRFQRCTSLGTSVSLLLLLQEYAPIILMLFWLSTQSNVACFFDTITYHRTL